MLNNNEQLIRIKLIYNCKWYHYIYYWFYDIWQILKHNNKSVLVIHHCIKDKEPSSEIFYAPYIPITSDDLKKNLPKGEKLESRFTPDENGRCLY